MSPDLVAYSIVATVTSIVASNRNERLRETNQRLAGRFDGQMRVLTALASESDDRIESITVARCDQCPHCAGAAS